MSASRGAKLAELRALRAAGKKRLSTYEIEEQGSLYDEVDEEGYKKVVRERLDEDDFVVDDNGAGYADDGREVWNDERMQYSDSDDEELPARGKAAKRKREEDSKRKEQINNGISKYFNASTAPAAPKSRVRGCLLLVRRVNELTCCSPLQLPMMRLLWRIY
jgi:DNA polymerase alpha subunit A